MLRRLRVRPQGSYADADVVSRLLGYSLTAAQQQCRFYGDNTRGFGRNLSQNFGGVHLRKNNLGFSSNASNSNGENYSNSNTNGNSSQDGGNNMQLCPERARYFLGAIGGAIPPGIAFDKIDSLSRRIPTQVMEEVSNECGGVINFVRMYPQYFETRQVKDGGWTVRHRLRSSFDLCAIVFGAWKPYVQRTFHAQFVLPNVGMSLTAMAIKEQKPASEVLRQVCEHPKGTFLIYCDEIIDASGRRLFGPGSVAPPKGTEGEGEGAATAASPQQVAHRYTITEEQGNNIYIVPSETAAILSVLRESGRTHTIAGGATSPYSDYEYPPSHEVCRLARNVDANQPTPFSSLRPMQGRDLYAKAMDIILSDRDRFDITDGSPSIETVEYLTHLLASPPPTAPGGEEEEMDADSVAYAVDNLTASLRTIQSVRYIVQSRDALYDRAKHMTTHTIPEVEMELQNTHRAIAAHQVHFIKGKELRDKFVGQLWWLRHPRGSPFADPEVLEQLLYDMLGDFPNCSIDDKTLRNMLWKSRYGELVHSLKNQQLVQMKRLLTTEETGYSCLRVSRKSNLGDVDPSPRRLSRPELALEILSCFPRPYPYPEHVPAKCDNIYMGMTKNIRAQLVASYGGLEMFLGQHRATFRMGTGVTPEVYTSEQKLDTLSKELTALCISSPRHEVEGSANSRRIADIDHQSMRRERIRRL